MHHYTSGAALDFISGRHNRWAVHFVAVQAGAIRGIKITEPPMAVMEAQERVSGRNRPVREAHVTLRIPAKHDLWLRE
jgi:hypothetical protein